MCIDSPLDGMTFLTCIKAINRVYHTSKARQLAKNSLEELIVLFMMFRVLVTEDERKNLFLQVHSAWQKPFDDTRFNFSIVFQINSWSELAIFLVLT